MRLGILAIVLTIYLHGQSLSTPGTTPVYLTHCTSSGTDHFAGFATAEDAIVYANNGCRTAAQIKPVQVGPDTLPNRVPSREFVELLKVTVVPTTTKEESVAPVVVPAPTKKTYEVKK